ncbi:MAG: hypothetical protein ACLQOZ_05575 [Acidimicrobiales bacterium]
MTPANGYGAELALLDAVKFCAVAVQVVPLLAVQYVAVIVKVPLGLEAGPPV